MSARQHFRFRLEADEDDDVGHHLGVDFAARQPGPSAQLHFLRPHAAGEEADAADAGLRWLDAQAGQELGGFARLDGVVIDLDEIGAHERLDKCLFERIEGRGRHIAARRRGVRIERIVERLQRFEPLMGFVLQECVEELQHIAECADFALRQAVGGGDPLRQFGAADGDIAVRLWRPLNHGPSATRCRRRRRQCAAPLAGAEGAPHSRFR